MTDTRTLERIMHRLRLDEGSGPMNHGRHMPYKCPAGALTIGWGHNLDAKGLTREQANQLLEDDIDDAARALAMARPWVADLDPVRQGVLVMMTFQLGLFGLLGFKHAMEAAEFGDYDSAAVAFLDSKWAEQDSPARALRLMEMFRTGKWL